VIRKVLRTGATRFEYERSVQPRPKIGPWQGELDRLLLENERKPARERLTLIRVFEELRGLGYSGGYDAIRRYAKAWRSERSATAAAFVPLSFAPGEAYQFDWSHEIVVVGGVTTKVKVAHIRLCHSRMPFVRAYPREGQEMVFDAHDRAFAFFKGACSHRIRHILFEARHGLARCTWRGLAHFRAYVWSSVVAYNLALRPPSFWSNRRADSPVRAPDAARFDNEKQTFMDRH
jgi:hypothetical protein